MRLTPHSINNPIGLVMISTIILSLLTLEACALKSTDQTTAIPAVIKFRNLAATPVFWHDQNYSINNLNSASIEAKILGFNDFHGQLNPKQSARRPIGGAINLASYLRAASHQDDGHTIIVHAGDMVGVSSPESALLQDEPSIQFFNLLANEHCNIANTKALRCNLVGTLGNHEFDEGRDELNRLLFGGIHASAPSFIANWPGSKAPYVSANVIDINTGKTLLPPYVIKEIAGIKVGFIGAVLKNTPNHVIASGIKGLKFVDEATAINHYAAELKAKNVRAIIVTIHQGVHQKVFGDNAIIGKGNIEGEIIDIVSSLDEEIDIVISGHAHGYTNLLVATNTGHQILLTQAFSAGTAFSDITINLDANSGDIIYKSAVITSTWETLQQD